MSGGTEYPYTWQETEINTRQANPVAVDTVEAS